MNARAINSAAGVILAAIEQDRVPAGIACALDAAGLLNSPEHAADLVRLREELTMALDQRNTVFQTNTELLTRVEVAGLARIDAENETRKLVHDNRELRERIAEIEAERAETRPADEDPIAYALTTKADDVSPQVHKLRALLAGQREQAGGTPC